VHGSFTPVCLAAGRFFDMQSIAEDPATCALFLFPTKALAQDQRNALMAMAQAALGHAAPAIDVYDGDTPSSERATIRERAQLLITNPDMLHVSVLPFHRTFHRLLSSLRYVVVDEGHMYKGAFGCHAACVFRRLRRICEREYGSSPTFAVASATSANPEQHVKDLLGVQDVVVIDQDGSPHGPRRFVMWNPPQLVPWVAASEQAGMFGGPPGELSRTEGRARGHKEKRFRDAERRRQLNEGGGASAGATCFPIVHAASYACSLVCMLLALHKGL
jgi:ATP-dependent helicase YprA (DUF1998 family)